MHKVSTSAIALAICALPVVAGPLGDAAKSGDVRLVNELLDDGADVDEADTFGTALHFAALNNHPQVVEALLERGADLSASSNLLGTPLHAATTRNNPDVVAILLEAGAPVGARDKDSFTPLHIAAKQGYSKIAGLLVSAGADVNVVAVGVGGNSNMKVGELTPLHYALHEGNSDIVDMLRSAGANAVPVQSAAKALSKANAQRGREIAVAYCKTCHALEPEDDPPSAYDAGPPLIGIYGADVARDSAFDYSDALREFGGAWTEDRLYSFILRPMLTVPGTYMGHQLVDAPGEIADVTAYLKSQVE